MSWAVPREESCHVYHQLLDFQRYIAYLQVDTRHFAKLGASGPSRKFGEQLGYLGLRYRKQRMTGHHLSEGKSRRLIQISGIWPKLYRRFRVCVDVKSAHKLSVAVLSSGTSPLQDRKFATRGKEVVKAAISVGIDSIHGANAANNLVHVQEQDKTGFSTPK